MSAAERVAAGSGLRGATHDDLPAMAEIFVRSWLGAYGGIVPDDVLDSLQPGSVAADLAVGLDDPRLITVLALGTAGEPVGFARFGDDVTDRSDRSDREGGAGGRDGYLAALYVHPAASGLGIGGRLLRHALDAMPGRAVGLWVFEANSRARSVYEKAGFRPAGPRRTDPRWRTPQIPMRRPARNEPRPLPALPDLTLPRVRAVSTTVVQRPLRRPFRTALRTVHTLSAIEVTLHTADGLSATGSTVATPAVTGDTADAVLAALHGPISHALRRGPRDFAQALRAVEAAAPGVASARAAADVALHHLAASSPAFARTGLPGLLGNTPLPVRSDLTISVDSPAAMATSALEAAEAGFDTLKLKLADAEVDVRRVSEVHAGLGGAERRVVLRVDANQAWTPDEAVHVLDRIAALGIDLELVEQPVRAADLAGLAHVRRNSPWPVLADESVFTADDVRRVADASAADLVNLKLLKCGGLGPAREVVAACAETGLGLVVGCMLEPAEGVAAARHLAAAATVGPLAHDLDAGWWAAT
ncbi:GNAT family N-acetyltransferase [Streptodolium elevatio]|uniref:GNAT family N-acetyltransferase n=1 Tax=Streptodolium elevatio TaxID=3157996 RepID=A0ABV3DP04_9ACTN